MSELPSIQNCHYSATSGSFLGDTVTMTGTAAPSLSTYYTPPTIWDLPAAAQPTQNQMQNRRIVQVFIVDPNEDVPLENSLLYQDEKPHLTDLTDQELFFELDIKAILEKHNTMRVLIPNKEASEGKAKDVFLEPAKIRDLKMTVVNVAAF